MCVLVIDSNPTYREFLQQAIETTHDTVKTGRSLRDISFESPYPDAVVLGVNSEDTDICSALKDFQQKVSDQIPVIVVAEKGVSCGNEIQLFHGVYDILLKWTTSPAQVVRSVLRGISQHKTLQALNQVTQDLSQLVFHSPTGES